MRAGLTPTDKIRDKGGDPVGGRPNFIDSPDLPWMMRKLRLQLVEAVADERVALLLWTASMRDVSRLSGVRSLVNASIHCPPQIHLLFSLIY